MKKQTPDTELDLDALFEAAKPISKHDLDRLKEAGKLWENNAVERSDFHKALFVRDICSAMEATGMSQSDLAKKWGRSRQYLSKLLRQDKRTNFTIETMVELTILLGLGFSIDTAKTTTSVAEVIAPLAKVVPINPEGYGESSLTRSTPRALLAAGRDAENNRPR